MDVDLWDEVIKLFDKIQPGLLDSLLTKGLLLNEAYMALVRKEDGEEYEPNRWQDSRVENFKLIVLTSARHPNEAMLERFHVLRVKVKG